MKKLATLVITLFLGAGLALGQTGNTQNQAPAKAKTTTTAKAVKAKSGKKVRKGSKKVKKTSAKKPAVKNAGVAKS